MASTPRTSAPQDCGPANSRKPAAQSQPLGSARAQSTTLHSGGAREQGVGSVGAAKPEGDRQATGESTHSPLPELPEGSRGRPARARPPSRPAPGAAPRQPPAPSAAGEDSECEASGQPPFFSTLAVPGDWRAGPGGRLPRQQRRCSGSSARLHSPPPTWSCSSRHCLTAASFACCGTPGALRASNTAATAPCLMAELGTRSRSKCCWTACIVAQLASPRCQSYEAADLKLAR